MAFEISTGKKQNSQGRVAVSLRFRMGKIDQQAKTNLWVSPAMVKTGQRRNSVAGLSKIDRQTVGFLIRIS